MWPGAENHTWVSITALPALGEAWWAVALAALVLAALAGTLGLWSYRRNLARERAITERERAINRDLRELAELKDLLLADRAADIADRERLISELRSRNAELARFNYTVSHDLKNPLVTIKAYVGLVKRDAAAGNAERMIRDIDRIGAAAEHMHQLLEELLELSRVGRSMAKPVDVPMGQLVREAAARYDTNEGGVEIEIATDLPTVRGDRKRLLEVLHNLLDNAISYMGSQPSPRVEVGTRRTVRDGEVQETIFYVRDNGAGIEPPYHEKVFGLFERLDAETEGTGIGLALVKRIVEVHGGRVWVESKGRGHGSTFCFTLSDQAASAG
ncbi:MAG: hypothetical protein GY719_25315 [bacterium]|nr:hypothetical protein [bacterium]